MSFPSALILGLCLIIAAILHGGVWTPGHDFIVNRFTGRYEFVPSDDPGEEAEVPARATLTPRDLGDRVAASPGRR